MKLLLIRFIEICLLRAGPQDLPASSVLLVATLAVYSMAGLLLSLLNTTLAYALLLTIVDMLLLAGLLYLVLLLRTRTTRFVQALTALAGTGAILEMSAWPVLYWQQLSTATDGPGLVMSSLLLSVLLFFPLEMKFHFLENMALGMTRLFEGVGGRVQNSI